MSIKKILEPYNYWDTSPCNLGYIRKKYLDSLKDYVDTNLIKVLVGQRRAGKSYILRQLINYLQTEKNIPSKNILYINQEIEALSFINTHISTFYSLKSIGITLPIP